MRKFIIYTRSIPGVVKTADIPTVVEVEGELVVGTEAPFGTLLPGEYWFQITQPEFLYDTREVRGSKSSVPPVYHSHAMYDAIEQARIAAEEMVQDGFEFETRKYRTEYSTIDLLNKIKEIQVFKLPV